MDMTAQFDVPQLLTGITLFAGLDTSLLEDLAQHTTIRRVDKGVVIFREGDRPSALYFLLDGQVKRSVCSPEGDEKVLDVYYPRQLFGDAEVMSGRLCMACAEATHDSILLAISHKAVLALVSENIEVAMRLLQSIAQRHHALERDIVSRRFQNTTDRVLEYLCDLTNECDSVDTAEFELRTSKQVLASHLDMTPETLSRNLRRLIDARLISVSGRRVKIHRRAVANHLANATPHGAQGRVLSLRHTSTI